MSEFTYNDVLNLIPEARPRKIPEPGCDPTLEHCIELRKFQNEIEQLILLTNNLKEIYDDSERESMLQFLPSIPELPQLINKNLNNNQKNVAFEEIMLSEDTVLKLVSKSVARVLFVIGYTDMPSQLLKKMSKIIIDYVKSMTEMIIQLMPEDGSISVELLEVVLKEKGINGVGELYSFYTERIVKFHKGLYLKCQHLCKDLQNNLKKPDASLMKNNTPSSIDEECSNDVDQEEQSNEANIDDSSKNSLDSGALAEDLYLSGKLKEKSACFSHLTEHCEISNYKNSHGEKITYDQEKFPFKIAISSESFSSVENELLKNKISKYCGKKIGLLRNSTYNSDDGPIEPRSNVLNCDSECNSDDEEEVPIKNVDSFFNDKLPDQITSTVASEEKVPIKKAVCYYNDEPLDQSTNVDNEKIVPVKETIYYCDDEPLDKSSSIAIDEEESTNAKSTKLIMGPFNEITSIVTNKTNNAICPESYSNPENLVSFVYAKPNSDSFSELSGIFDEKISSKSVCNSNDKLLRNGKVKRVSVDSESLESLFHTENKKKRFKLMKHGKVSENNTYIDVKSSKNNLKGLEQSSSSDNFTMDDILHKNELEIISEDINFNNNLNLETCSNFETCFNIKDSCEISDNVTDLSSSSENEAEQIWLSL